MKFSLPKAFDLITLVLILLFFAFYRIPEHYGFEFDQERDYNVVREIVSGNFTLIGPRVVSSAGFFLGPYYYYLNVPFYLLFRGEPIYAAYLTGVVNSVSALLIYLFLKKETKGRLIPLLAAALWISSANRSSWNVSFVPLFFLSFLFFFFDLLHKWRFRSAVFLTLIFSFSLHFHSQMIFLFPLWLFALLSRKPKPKQILLLVAAFLVSFVPLFFFDLRHDFINTQAIIRFLTQPSVAAMGTAIFRPLYSLRQFSTALMPLHPIFQHNLVLTGILLVAITVFATVFRRYLPLLAIVAVSIILLGFYRELTWPEYYHYLSGLAVILLVFLLAARIPLARWFLLALVVAVVYRNYLYISAAAEAGAYSYKKALILYMLEQNQPYEKINIDNDFRFGEGLGFSPIREYYEKKEGSYHPTLRFYVSYAESPKHNATKKTFGLYGVSMVESGKK